MARRDRPNIILVTIDCLRVDRVGAYGYQPSITPCLDQLAASGSFFVDATAQGPGTTFALPAIMNSTYPSPLSGSEGLSAASPPIAVKLQQAGYATAAFVSNPYLRISSGYGRGFDLFDEGHRRVFAQRLQRGINRLSVPLGLDLQSPPYPSARKVTTRARTWLAAASQPFFLWLHFMDAHWPYNLRHFTVVLPGDKDKQVTSVDFARRLQDRPDSIRESQVATLQSAYAAGIQYVDRHVRQLMEAVEAQSLLDETWILVTADHGEEFGEHGGFFHTHKLYEELVQVPLIVRFPAGSRVPRRVAQQVRHLDLAPTILDVVGLPPEEAYEGTSLLPLLGGKNGLDLSAISQVFSPERWILALRHKGWKLILHLLPDSLDVASVELYNLQVDPGETRNLADSQRPISAALRMQLLAFAATRKEREASTNAPKTELDQDVLERLRALGYLP
jgi:arylsulfatase A-like enzyme